MKLLRSLLFALLCFLSFKAFASDIEITDLWYCIIDEEDEFISMSGTLGGKIYNNSSTATGSLILRIWLTDEPFYGGSITGYDYRLGSLSSLSGSSYYEDVVVSNDFTDLPPNGTYNVVFTVEEYIGGTYYIVDWVNIGSTVRVSSTYYAELRETVDAGDYSGSSNSGTASVYSASWSNSIDSDSDGYYSSRTLTFDVDITNSASATVYAAVYSKLSSASTYSLYTTTSYFSISGTESGDAQSISVAGLSEGTYDFKIVIYSSSGTLLDTYYPSDDSDLDNEKFEFTDIVVEPELAITKVQARSTTIDAGDYFDFVATVVENPVATEYESIKVDYYLSSNSDISVSDTYLKTINYLDLTISSNGSTLYSGDIDNDGSAVSSLQIPENIASGYYYLGSMVYADGVLECTASSSQAVQIYVNGVSNSGTVFVYDASWDDSIDSDYDGYYSSRSLTFDVDITNSATAEVYAKVYYKSGTSSSYSLYTTTSEFMIAGDVSDDAQSVTVSGLTQGWYDFYIDIYASDGTYLATYGSYDDSDLYSQYFEYSESGGSNSGTVSVYDTWWEDGSDSDYDGYYSSRILTFDVDITGSATKTVYAKVYYKSGTSSSYSLYTTTSEFMIAGDVSGDAQSVTVSGLTQGSYDFYINIYASDGTYLATYDSDDYYDLADQYFEYSESGGSNSGTVSVYDAWWEDGSDSDYDGYYSSRILTFDVDITGSATKTVYAKVYYKSGTSSSYSLYTTTSEFMIAGDVSDDAQSITVSGLTQGSYDFYINIYASDGTYLATYDSDDYYDLADQYFEYSESGGSNSGTVSVYDASWSSSIDSDYDGYYSSQTLTFDVDITGSATKTVYAKVYYKSGTSSSYSLYTTTPEFMIAGDVSGDAQSVTVSGLTQGSYDFYINIYASDGTYLVTCDSYYYSDLADVNFENTDNSEPDTNTDLVFDFSWASITDADMDNYWSGAALLINVDVKNSGTETLYATILYKESSASTYRFYETVSTFTVSGQTYDDVVGLSVDFLDGTYDFRVDIYDAGGTCLTSCYPSEYSSLESVGFELERFDGNYTEVQQETNQPTIYPTICADNLNVVAPAGSLVTIANASGVLVGSFTMDNSATNFDVTNLPSGNYIVRIGSKSFPFVKR